MIIPLWRILLIATIAEVAGSAAVIGLAGLLLGPFSPWMDLATHPAVLTTLAGFLAAPAAYLGGLTTRQRRVLVGLSLTAGLSGVMLIGPELVAAVSGFWQVRESKSLPLRIVQFNIWVENTELDTAVKVLVESNADVIALEETNPIINDNLRELHKVYPFEVSCAQQWRCGILLLSKTRPLSSSDFTPQTRPQPGDLSMVKAVYVAPDGKPFTLFATHYLWPLPPSNQAVQRATLKMLVKDAGARGAILVGDFNLTPWSHALRNQDTDLLPLTRRTRGLSTYPATIPRARLPWPLPFLPIDHIYASPDWRVTTVKTLRRAGSDHYAIMANFTR